MTKLGACCEALEAAALRWAPVGAAPPAPRLIERDPRSCGKCYCRCKQEMQSGIAILEVAAFAYLLVASSCWGLWCGIC